jgi:hypothetical protein
MPMTLADKETVRHIKWKLLRDLKDLLWCFKKYPGQYKQVNGVIAGLKAIKPPK